MSITAIPSSTFSTSQSTSQLSNATKVMQQNFAQIGQDLTSGNLSAAQQDYSTLQQNLQSQASSALTTLSQHHSGVGRPIQQTSPAAEMLAQLGQDLTSGNLSAAQQAYTSLQSLTPLSGLGSQTSGQSVAPSSAVSFSA